MHIRPVLLALGLSSLALAACGGDDDSPSSAAPATTATGAAPTTTAAVTTAVGATATTAATAGGDGYGTPATASAPATGAVRGSPAVATAGTSLGTIVVDGKGMTLYRFENDTDGKSACSGGCATAWPPLLSTGSDTAGAGIDASKLGTVARDDGTRQVTYAGKPLYYFAGDRAAGDTNGQGVNDVWYVLDASGAEVDGS